MKKTYYIFAIALMAFSGCQMHETDAPSEKTYTLSATLEGKNDTKTHLSDIQDGIYYPYWSTGDKIAVFIDDSSSPGTFNLTGGENTANGTFTGTQFGNLYTAYYPLSGAISSSGGTITVNLPSTFTLSEESSTFPEGSFPMAAVSESDNLQFKNLCAVLKHIISMYRQIQ